MACQHCGQKPIAVCPNCDSHLFQAGVTIRNDSAIIMLKEREQLAKESAARLKELRIRVIRLKIAVGITVSIGLALAIWVSGLKITLESYEKPGPPIPFSYILPFPQQARLWPDERIAESFLLEGQRRNVTIDVSIECLDCMEESLAMIVLDEAGYQRFEAGQGYEPIYSSTNIRAFAYNGALDGGRYYVVFHNFSRSQTIFFNINAKLSCDLDELSPPRSDETPTGD